MNITEDHYGKLIYHEKQSCAMCGQHVCKFASRFPIYSLCKLPSKYKMLPLFVDYDIHTVNSLLQGPYFTAEDLAEIAHELDEQERELLRIQGGLTDGEQVSHNVDDSGNFSLQVLNLALQRSHNLSLVRDSETLNVVFQNLEESALDETNAPAFVCNRYNHWQAIRFLHGSYWDLNSLSNAPTKISVFYLTAYLGQLIQDGWTIFTVVGVLPKPMNDITIGDRNDWYTIGQQISNSTNYAAAASTEDDTQLQAALRASLESATITSEDAELQAALKASLDSVKQEQQGDQNVCTDANAEEDDEDEDLKAAIALSLQEK